MPTLSDNAICIRHWDYSETSQTVSLFTREHGVVRGVAKGSRREKANFSGGIDLFAEGEVRAIVKPGAELANIIEWTLIDAHWPLRDNLAAHRRALYFADLVHHMVRDHDPHSALFQSFERALADLGNPPAIEHITVRFLWSLLVEAGYRPEVDRDAATGRDFASREQFAFDPQAGGVVPAAPGLEAWRMRPETLAALRNVAKAHANAADDAAGGDALAGSSTAPVPHTTADPARRAGCLLSAYIRSILGYEPATLGWVFPELVERR